MTLSRLLISVHQIPVVRVLSITLAIALAACRSSVLEPMEPHGMSIAYSMPSETHIKLEILNSYYTLVRLLVDDVQPPGSYSVEWDYRDESGDMVPEGIYLARLSFDDDVITMVMYPVLDE